MTTSPLRSAALHAVPIEIRVCVGHARPLLKDMMALSPESVVPLDSTIDDPVLLYVGNKLIAEGELVELDGDRPGQLAVRITRLSGDADGTE